MAADLPEYWVDVRCDYDKAALTSNFSKRGWTRVSDSEYHFYWSSAVNAKKLFDPGPYLGVFLCLLCAVSAVCRGCRVPCVPCDSIVFGVHLY